MAANDNDADLLVGAKAIASHLGVTSRQVYKFCYEDGLPTFRLGGSVAARKSTLAKHFAKLEKAA